MTGVKYGVFDLDRLVHMLRISPEGEKIILDRGGIAPIEKYLHARAHMHRQVYLHKTVAAAEAMLTSLFRRARDLMRQGGEAGVERDAPLGRALAEPEELTVAEFLELDDVVAWSQIKRWTRSDDSVLSDLADRMLRRRLFKTIEVEADADLTAALERARGVVAAAGLDPNYYLIEFESSDTPYAPYDPTSNRTADRIFIETGRGGVIDVADASATIAAMARERPRLRRVVFPEAGPTGDIRSTLEPVFSRSS
jgi:hypothetical protein